MKLLICVSIQCVLSVIRGVTYFILKSTVLIHLNKTWSGLSKNAVHSNIPKNDDFLVSLQFYILRDIFGRNNSH